mmetsp:Transcript_95592/g.169751  ORF Transcript_95592/g.169751 Transcript_95592/m.169751 type:complete len:97 (-) Transcript_95592:85-375(-)|eukprot:CAMPEP_0197644504 /NCGR_PEP_ID=MMETSP1338-20131121/17456_1 /TAXON_ID=43686 ORGANISM="Pelagodinium beii, Strain RCC1491" /NCGR_SAMPLE_ID=MMETSP1338 /ASSEMBLY_ACC=CAM_ASM_000754 /LENGTH=96 /DNA_ID=CAMNT_0043217907 /DNA_START=83 /DNA_END=373 /DNA_ORIENTATION=-
MSRMSSVLMPVASVVVMVMGALSMLSSCFLPAPAGPASESLALRGTAAAAALASAVPLPAEAFSEKEQYQFGLVFIPFFLVFYVAALVRMFTLGKL